MGNGIVFDTLVYAKKLRSVGFTEEQALLAHVKNTGNKLRVKQRTL